MRDAVESKRGSPVARRQLTSDELTRWIESGHTIGNHSWDHPLLDRCEEDEQLRQIDRAHEWLVDRFGEATLFAYPNGNFTHSVDSRLRQLGYSAALLFDHRLHDRGDPLRMSRIRVNADDELSEFRAKVSGLHPWIHHALGRT